MRLTTMVSILAALVFATGCASSETSAENPADRECFNIQSISSWSTLDDKHLYVKGVGAANHYLLTMFSRCPGIRSAQVLAFSNQTNRLCSNDFGRVTYRDGSTPYSCRINDIERVNSRDEAKAIAEARKNAKDDNAE